MQASLSANRTRPLTAWLGALAVLAAAALLVAGLNDFSLWFDEIRMVLPTLAWEPLKLTTWVFRPGHPPLYFLMLRGWITVMGQSDFSLRMMSWLIGVLTAVVILRIGKDLSRSLFGGIAAALLFASMGMVRYYVHETHNYALLMLACMVLLLFYERWWAHPERRAYAVGSVLATAGVMYTHYYGAYFILVLNVFVVISGWRRVLDIFRWIVFEILAAVLYIPWMGVVLFLMRKVTTKLGLKRRFQGINSDSTKWSTIVAWVNSLLSDQLILFAALLIISGVGIYLLTRMKPAQRQKILMPVLMLALLVFGTVVVAMGANMIFRTFTPRRVIYALPALALLIGYALVGLPGYVREAVLVGAVALIFMAGYSSYLPGNWGFRQMIQAVQADYRPGDLVFLQEPPNSLPGLPLTYYAHTLLPRDTAVMDLGDAGLQTPDSRRYFVSQIFQPHMLARDAFWVISAADPVYGETSLNWVGLLDRKFMQARSERIGSFNVTLFTAQPQTRGALADGVDVSDTLGLPVTLGNNQFELDRAQISSKGAHPGDKLVVWLDWRALTLPDQDYSVYVHLLKGSQIITQQDGDPVHLGSPLRTTLWPVESTVLDEHDLTIPTDTPPGAYSLVIGWYNRTTGARLQVVPAGVVPGGVTLATIEISTP